MYSKYEFGTKVSYSIKIIKHGIEEVIDWSRQLAIVSFFYLILLSFFAEIHRLNQQ